jgi:hypothetical protein
VRSSRVKSFFFFFYIVTGAFVPVIYNTTTTPRATPRKFPQVPASDEMQREKNVFGMIERNHGDVAVVGR